MEKNKNKRKVNSININITAKEIETIKENFKTRRKHAPIKLFQLTNVKTIRNLNYTEIYTIVYDHFNHNGLINKDQKIVLINNDIAQFFKIEEGVIKEKEFDKIVCLLFK